MRPILFHLGSTPIYSFGVLVSLAFIAAGWVMRRDFARKNEPRDLAWEIVGFGAVGGLLGARLHQALHYWPEFVAAPMAFMTAPTGLIWYGGVLGGALATLWPIRRARVPYASVLDTAALGLTIGLAMGRIGCHLSGDGDWGTPTALPWGLAYPNGTVPWPHPPGVLVHPAALYEMLALIGIFVFLLRVRSRMAPAGATFAIYLILSAAARFLVEFIRTNPAAFFGLTEAQWTSIALDAGAALWLSRSACSPLRKRDTLNSLVKGGLVFCSCSARCEEVDSLRHGHPGCRVAERYCDDSLHRSRRLDGATRRARRGGGGGAAAHS